MTGRIRGGTSRTRILRVDAQARTPSREPDGRKDRMSATAIAPKEPQDPQYMEALRRANEVRLARAQTRREVAAGELGVGEVVLSCPKELRTMTVFELLTAQRRWGRKRSRDLLAEVGLPETKSLGTMTERQRRLVADRLRH